MDTEHSPAPQRLAWRNRLLAWHGGSPRWLAVSAVVGWLLLSTTDAHAQLGAPLNWYASGAAGADCTLDRLNDLEIALSTNCHEELGVSCVDGTCSEAGELGQYCRPEPCRLTAAGDVVCEGECVAGAGCLAGECVPAGSHGQPCLGYPESVTGGGCSYPLLSCVQGQCILNGTEGYPCTQQSSGDIMISQANECGAAIGLACIHGACMPAGEIGEPCRPEPCRYGPDGEVICEGLCDAGAACVDGACVAAGRNGEPCLGYPENVSSGSPCSSPLLSCVQDQCTLAGFEGYPCRTHRAWPDDCEAGLQCVPTRSTDPNAPPNYCEDASKAGGLEQFCRVCNGPGCSQCDGSLTCYGGWCVALGTMDRPCRASETHQCDDMLYCIDGMCRTHQHLSRQSNACVENVEEQFAALDTANASVLRVLLPSGAQSTEPLSSLPFWPSNLTAEKTRHSDNCHIQGFQRLPGGWLAFSANSMNNEGGLFNDCDDLAPWDGGGAHMFLGRLPSKDGISDESPWGSLTHPGDADRIFGEIRLNLDTELGHAGVQGYRVHPGGMQMVGDYMYVGLDGGGEKQAEFRVYNMREPLNPMLVSHSLIPTSQASAVGAVELPDGSILTGVGDLTKSGTRKVHFYRNWPNRTNWSQEHVRTITPMRRECYMFVPSTDPLAPYSNSQEKVPCPAFVDEAGNWLLPFDFHSYAAMNFVRECGTDKVYMFGMTNTEDWPKCAASDPSSGNIGGSTDGAIHLYEIPLNADYEPDGFIPVASRSTASNNASGCAGPGMYVSPEGRLMFYAMEHDARLGSVFFYEYD